jgi:hypothetical protein
VSLELPDDCAALHIPQERHFVAATACQLRVVAMPRVSSKKNPKTIEEYNNNKSNEGKLKRKEMTNHNIHQLNTGETTEAIDNTNNTNNSHSRTLMTRSHFIHIDVHDLVALAAVHLDALLAVWIPQAHGLVVAPTHTILAFRYEVSQLH